MASEWVVGRGKDCDIRLDDDTVSRRHMKLTAEGGGRYTIADLDSSGGTYVRTDRGWRTCKTEAVQSATPIRLGEHETTPAELLGRPQLRNAAFISYATPDRVKAERTAEYLEARGYKCWIAPRDVRAGRDYGEEIIHGIETAQSLVLIHSSAANDSTYVKREVERAVSKRKPVLPIRIEDVPLSPGLELFVSSAHWIDAWAGEFDDHLARLSASLANSARVPGGRLETRPPRKPGVEKRPRGRAPWRAAAAAAVVLIVVGAVVAYLSRDEILAPPPPAPQPASPSEEPIAKGGTEGAESDTSQVVGNTLPSPAGDAAISSVRFGDIEVSLVAASIVGERQVLFELGVVNHGTAARLTIVDDNNTTVSVSGDTTEHRLEVRGIAHCGRYGWNSRDASGACVERTEEGAWTLLEPGLTYDLRISTRRTSQEIRADLASAKIRFLTRSGDDWEMKDLSFARVPLAP